MGTKSSLRRKEVLEKEREMETVNTFLLKKGKVQSKTFLAEKVESISR